MVDTLPTIGVSPSPKTKQTNDVGLLVTNLGDGYKGLTTTGTVDNLVAMSLAYDFVEPADRTTMVDFLKSHRGQIFNVPLYLDDFSGSTTGLFYYETWNDSVSANPSLYSITINLQQVNE